MGPAHDSTLLLLLLPPSPSPPYSLSASDAALKKKTDRCATLDSKYSTLGQKHLLLMREYKTLNSQHTTLKHNFDLLQSDKAAVDATLLETQAELSSTRTKLEASEGVQSITLEELVKVENEKEQQEVSSLLFNRAVLHRHLQFRKPFCAGGLYLMATSRQTFNSADTVQAKKKRQNIKHCCCCTHSQSIQRTLSIRAKHKPCLTRPASCCRVLFIRFRLSLPSSPSTCTRVSAPPRPPWQLKRPPAATCPPAMPSCSSR